MTPPSPPAIPMAPAPPPSPIQSRWRGRTSVTLLILGVLLVIASAFLPWLNITIYRFHGTPQQSVLSTTYSVWALRYSVLVPFCGWLPLALVIATLLKRGRGRPHVGRLGLVGVCLLGVVAVVFGVGLSEVSLTIGGIGYHGSSTTATLLAGWWVYLTGYAVLIVGSLLLGRAPASQAATRTASPGGNSQATLFVPRGGLDSHRG